MSQCSFPAHSEIREHKSKIWNLSPCQTHLWEVDLKKDKDWLPFYNDGQGNEFQISINLFCQRRLQSCAAAAVEMVNSWSCVLSVRQNFL